MTEVPRSEQIGEYTKEEDTREGILHDQIDELNSKGKLSFNSRDYMTAESFDPKLAIEMADEYWNMAIEEGKAIIEVDKEEGKKIVHNLHETLLELSKRKQERGKNKNKAA